MRSCVVNSRALLATMALVAVTAFAPGAVRAQDATWLLNPGSGDFDTAANWSPATVPTGTAFFNTSNTTALSFSTNTTVGGWTFNAGASAYTFANNQLLQFIGAGIVINSGNATININIGGDLEFYFNSTAGNATINDNYNMGFNNSSTAGNSVITNGVIGDLRFHDNSTAGNATITNSGTIFFFDNSTAGNAAIINNSGGKVDFSGSTGPAGDNELSAGSIAGAGTYLLGANQLTVGGNNLSTEVSGTISGVGGGSLVKVGTGTLTLSGTNAYTGPTTINGGALIVNGSIAPSVLTTVNAGGTLGGNGTVGSTVVTSGGFLAPGPGGTPGTMTVSGSLAFQSGAFYLVQVNSTAASSASVSGTASLAGTVTAIFAPGSYIERSYTILTAAVGRIGTFDALTTSGLPADFQVSLSYPGNTAVLNLTAELFPEPTPPAPPYNFTINQINVGSAIDNYFNNGGALPPAFVSLYGLSGSDLANALTQIDGENATAAERSAFELSSEFLGLMLDPFVYGRGGFAAGGQPLGFAPDQQAALPPDAALAFAGVAKAPPPTFAQRWTAWGAAFGGGATANGDPVVVGSTNVTAATYGYAGGMDYHYSPDTVFGFALSGGGTNWNLAQGLGSGRSDAFQAGIYGTHYVGPAYLAAAFAFTNNWFTTNRVALGDQLTASFQGQSYGGRIEGGYRYAVAVEKAVIGVTPYAALQVQNFQTPAYSETGLTSGGFGLSYAAMSGAETRSELGGRFDDLTAINTMPLILRAKLAWAHDWVSNPALNASFESLPGTSFTVFGAPIPRDSALASAGAQLFFTPSWSFLVKFDGEFANGSQTYAGSGTLRYTW